MARICKPHLNASIREALKHLERAGKIHRTGCYGKMPDGEVYPIYKALDRRVRRDPASELSLALMFSATGNDDLVDRVARRVIRTRRVRGDAKVCPRCGIPRHVRKQRLHRKVA